MKMRTAEGFIAAQIALCIVIALFLGGCETTKYDCRDANPAWMAACEAQ